MMQPYTNNIGHVTYLKNALHLQHRGKDEWRICPIDVSERKDNNINCAIREKKV